MKNILGKLIEHASLSRDEARKGPWISPTAVHATTASSRHFVTVSHARHYTRRAHWLSRCYTFLSGGSPVEFGQDGYH